MEVIFFIYPLIPDNRLNYCIFIEVNDMVISS